MAEMRFKELTVDNLFDFCDVLNVIGVDEIIGAFDKKEIAALSKAGKNIESVGIAITMKIAGILIKNLSKARNEVCAFFAGCTIWDNGSSVTSEELRNLRISPFLKLIHDFFKKEDLADFFGEVAGYLGMEQPDLKN